MRRRLRIFIPVLVLTVALQMLAPIGLIWAATATPDPLATAPICSELGHNGAPGDAALPAHASCCPLCSIAKAPALPPANADSLAIERTYSALSWTFGGIVSDVDKFGGHAQARAPPRLS